MSADSSDRPMSGAGIAVRVGPWLWGAIVAWAVTYHYFTYVPGRMHMNDESYTYVWRSLEFIDAIAAGYWSPQWAGHLRGGLGSPYFGYYQPGFFYVVAAFASVLPLLSALAMAVWTFAFLAYAGVFSLVRGSFGVGPAVLAGTMMLLAAYVRTDLYVRGDLSEFAGMAMLAAALAALVGWLEAGGRGRWTALALTTGASVVLHPVAGLLGYATLGVTLVVWSLATRSLRRSIGGGLGLGAGVGLSAFYWLPIFLEWDAVQGEKARVVAGFPFVHPAAFFVVDPNFRMLKNTLGLPTLSLVAIAVVLLLRRWRDLEPRARRLAVALGVLLVGSTTLMTSISSPVWHALPLLGLVQFPWRLLLVQAIALAALTGCLPRLPPALPVVVAVGATIAAWPLLAATPYPVSNYRHCDTPAEIEPLVLIPDAADEWLPAGARKLSPSETLRARPTAVGGVVFAFEKHAGHLTAKVATRTGAVVTLPHYAFPLGWQATLDGRPIPTAADPKGLLTLAVPQTGTVEVRFRTTPARRTGLIVSGATLLLVLAVGTLGERRLR